jgi:hypothetical protein
MTPDELVMFTSEIACVEINTLRDEMTIIIPDDFDVIIWRPNGVGGLTQVDLVREKKTS